MVYFEFDFFNCIFFKFGPRSLGFYFCFEFFCEFIDLEFSIFDDI